MNFLFHRHLAAVELGSSAAGHGAMLPDLWRMADRRVRAQPGVVVSDGDDALVDVQSGIDHHLDVDLWFHALPAFTDGQRRTGERLRQPAFDAPRMGLLAHIAWELALDGALTLRLGVDATQGAVAEGLREAGGAAARAAALHHFSRVQRSNEERGRFDANMRRITAELATGDWIAHYTTARGLAFLLGRIRLRLGLPAATDEDADRLAPVCARLLEDAADVVPELLAQRLT